MSDDQSRRVLVVDDEPDIRDMLTFALQQRGLVVDSASDGREALDLVHENQYAVVVLDLAMPLADGFVFLEGIRGVSVPPSPVVLVVTGSESLAERLDPRLVHGVVRKPFDPHDVASVVAACAEIRSRSMFETMAIAAAIAGAPLVALLSSM